MESAPLGQIFPLDDPNLDTPSQTCPEVEVCGTSEFH